MQNKLLNCPFCNGMAELITKDEMWDSQMYRATFVRCEVCKAKTIEVWDTVYNDRPSEREKEVIERWNKRRPMKRIVEQLEESMNDAKNLWDDDEYYTGQANAYEYAIEIVKGGVDNG